MIPEDTAISLTPHGTVPKTHKVDVPLRPVINCMLSPTNGMQAPGETSKLLAGIFIHYIRNERALTL